MMLIYCKIQCIKKKNPPQNEKNIRMSALILTNQNRVEADQVLKKTQQAQQSVLPRSKTLWLAGKSAKHKKTKTKQASAVSLTLLLATN